MLGRTDPDAPPERTRLSDPSGLRPSESHGARSPCRIPPHPRRPRLQAEPPHV